MAGRDKGAVQLPGVELPMQAPRCFCCHTRETDLRPKGGRLLTPLQKPYCPKYLPTRIPHTSCTSCTSRISRTSHTVLIPGRVAVFSYTRPFLVVSCSGSDTRKISQTNIIAGSVGSRLQWIVQAVLLNPSLDIVIAKSMHVIPKVRRKGIC